MQRRQFLGSVAAAGAGALTVGGAEASGVVPGGASHEGPELHAPAVVIGGITLVKLTGSNGAAAYVNPASILSITTGYGATGVTTLIYFGGGSASITVQGSPDQVVATIQAQLA